MSIAKALQDWLKTFDGMELRPITSVQTDFAPLSPSAYALAPSGNTMCGKTVQFIAADPRTPWALTR